MTIAKSAHWKEKIKAGVLVQRLMAHAEGTIEMTATQIKAADILIKKVIPDVNRIEMSGLDGGPIETKELASTDKEIIARYLTKQKETK